MNSQTMILGGHVQSMPYTYVEVKKGDKTYQMLGNISSVEVINESTTAPTNSTGITEFSNECKLAMSAQISEDELRTILGTTPSIKEREIATLTDKQRKIYECIKNADKPLTLAQISAMVEDEVMTMDMFPLERTNLITVFYFESRHIYFYGLPNSSLKDITNDDKDPNRYAGPSYALHLNFKTFKHMRAINPNKWKFAEDIHTQSWYNGCVVHAADDKNYNATHFCYYTEGYWFYFTGIDYIKYRLFFNYMRKLERRKVKMMAHQSERDSLMRVTNLWRADINKYAERNLKLAEKNIQNIKDGLAIEWN